MTATTPVFDKTKEHGVIAHGDLAGQEPSALPAFFQNGHYFRPDGSYHSSDGQPKKLAPAAKAVKPPDSQPYNLTDAQVAELMKDPRAEELEALPRDELVKLINAANGPVIGGEGSQRMMIAWLIKNTKNDEL
jgi:hypothetical protein